MGGFAPLSGRLDAALSNYAKGYRNNDLVSDIFFPRVGVQRQTDKYWVWGREAQELTENDLRATGAGAEAVRQALSSDSYSCLSHALKFELADETRANFQAGDAEQQLTQTLQDKILLAKEKRFVDLVTSSAVVTQYVALTAGDKWSDPLNSDPRGDVDLAKDTIMMAGIRANAMVIGPTVFTALRSNEQVLKALAGVRLGVIDEPLLALFFGIDRVIVARAVKYAGATATSLFGAHAFLCHVSPTPGQMDLSFGKTFVWDSAPGTIGGSGVVVGRNPDPTAKSDIVGTDFYYDQKVTAAASGYLIQDAA
jgi:hypothetical protein